MKYYFCLVSYDEKNSGINVGRAFAYRNRSKWIEAQEGIHNYLTAGYVKGVDYVVVDNKAYALMKSYIDVTEHFVVILCVESISGCDI